MSDRDTSSDKAALIRAASLSSVSANSLVRANDNADICDLRSSIVIVEEEACVIEGFGESDCGRGGGGTRSV